ncbi:MAG: type II toxin-antitoxin system HicA family toxin [Bacteroidota bacterium]|nr:type II toxin-antitoxin system HicA family toxin [Bacteroidota bacterium]
MKYSELLRILKQNGWYEARQSGSHVIMKHKEKSGSITVPNHGSDEVKKGLLQAILKQTGINITKR